MNILFLIIIKNKTLMFYIHLTPIINIQRYNVTEICYKKVNIDINPRKKVEYGGFLQTARGIIFTARLLI